MNQDKKNINLLILITFILIINHKQINLIFKSILNIFGIQTIDYTNRKNKRKIDWIKLIFVIPVILLYFYDYNLESLMITSGISKIISNNLLSYILRVFGSFSLVLIYCKNVGLEPGINQKNIIKNPIFQFMILWGVTHAFTDARSEGLISVLLFYVMKYTVSNNITKSNRKKKYKRKQKNKKIKM